jgi:23S rRNA pseudouridine1911/1915/1917 synthase
MRLRSQALASHTPRARRIARLGREGAHDVGHVGNRDLSTSKPTLQLHIGADLASHTLADCVRRILANTSWNQARELCKRGKVRCNGALARDAAQRVAEGDFIEIDPRARRVRENAFEDGAVIHVDADVVVVNKPAGLLSVPFDAADKNTLVDRVRFWLRRETGFKGAELGVVQRLDKDTTGLIVFTRTLMAKRHLQQLLRQHDVERRYLALVHGEPVARRIETHLIENRGDGLRGSYGRFRRARGPVPASAQRAVTHIVPLERFGIASLVECRLETGRQHQIRIHLSEDGHPLIGEQVYIRDYAGARLAAERPMLHAESLGFAHPRTGRMLRFQQPPPEDFRDGLTRLRAATW